jgi:LmbE family N-acetylglucosaminyl deacetylase
MEAERPVVLSVAPHPDDELLGAPATLMALRDAGWRVLTLACSLGRAGDRERRRRELEHACTLAGFDLLVPEQLPPIGRDDDLAHAQTALAATVLATVQETGARLIVGPSPHDGHHAHEVAGRAIRDAVECGGSGERRVMFWGLWADLPFPNVLVRFGAERLAEIQAALAAHEGELARSRFDRLLAGRAAANAVLGPERAFGFGADGLEAGGRSGVGECAELLCEVGWSAASGWRLAPPRMFDTSDVEEPGRAPTGPELGWWLHATSARDQLRRA